MNRFVRHFVTHFFPPNFLIPHSFVSRPKDLFFPWLSRTDDDIRWVRKSHVEAYENLYHFMNVLYDDVTTCRVWRFVCVCLPVSMFLVGFVRDVIRCTSTCTSIFLWERREVCALQPPQEKFSFWFGFCVAEGSPRALQSCGLRCENTKARHACTHNGSGNESTVGCVKRFSPCVVCGPWSVPGRVRFALSMCVSTFGGD